MLIQYLSYRFRVLIDVRDGGEAEEAAAPTPNFLKQLPPHIRAAGQRGDHLLKLYYLSILYYELHR